METKVKRGDLVRAADVNRKMENIDSNDFKDRSISAKYLSPTYFQAGYGTTDAAGSAEILFNVPFLTIPRVFVQSADESKRGCIVDVYDIKTTSFKVTIRVIIPITLLPTDSHHHSFEIPGDLTYVRYMDTTCPVGHTLCASTLTVIPFVFPVHETRTGSVRAGHSHTSELTAASVDFIWIATTL